MKNIESGNKGVTRKQFIKSTLIGVGGIIAGSILGGCESNSYIRDAKQGPAAKTIPFNADWLFGGKFTQGSINPSFDDSHFKKIALPHTVTDLSWHKWDPSSWQENWIYRRHFNLSKEDFKNRRIFLDIGAAMTAATLVLNGRKLDTHLGGYLPLKYEISDYVHTGENVLAIKLNSHFKINVPPDRPNQGPRKVDYWQPGGIYRSAHLRIFPHIFLSDVFAKPVNVLGARPRLELECTINAETVPDSSTVVNVSLYKGKKKIGEISTPVKITKVGRTTVKLTLKNLEDIHLWDIDDPYLYDVVATLSIGDKSVHDYAVRTGFRDAKFTKKGFYLNGKRLKLFGLNRHQFYPFAGGAMPERVQAKDADILCNDLNCNMVRCSHYPQSEAFFDACDEIGLMAWEEAAGWGWLGNEQWKERVIRDVSQMVRRDRNHPSIIIWGARINETPNDVKLYTKTHKIAHQLDGSRQTSGAMAGRHNTPNFVQDVFSEDDYSSITGPHGEKMPILQPPRTDMPYFISEAVGTLSGPSKHYRRIDPADIQQGQAIAHARVHNIAASDKRYCGLTAWSGYDYPSGSGNQYGGVKYTGVVDLFRVPKPGAAIYQAQIDPEERAIIAPAFYWNFGPKSLPFKNGYKPMICSNCDRLELFVDDKYYATVWPDAKRFAHLPYPPSFVSFKEVDSSTKPELRIDGYLGNKKIIARSFSSDRENDRLNVAADDDEIIANGSDATHVVYRAVDKFGAPRPYAKKEVKLMLDGPATLIGQTPFPFEKNGGVGAVWVRSQPQKTGKIHLNAAHPVLGSGAVTITARES